MCDELLRHIQTHYGELRKLKYTDIDGRQKQLLTGQAVGLLLSMAGHAHYRDLVCFAGGRTLAEESGLTTQNVSKFIALFVQEGLLLPDGTEPSDRGGRPTNRYILNLPGFPLPKPEKLPDGGSFSPAGAPDFVPANVPANVPAIAPAGEDRTEPKQNKKEHTEKERVSKGKALKEKLEALGLEYAKRQQKASSGRVEIENPAAWLRSVAKAVNQPKGEHYETACGLIEASPDASTAELCDQLEQALNPDPFGGASSTSTSEGAYFAPGSGWVKPQESLEPDDEPRKIPGSYLLQRALQLFEKQGYPVALDYLQSKAEPDEQRALIDQLRAHATSGAGVEQEYLRMSDEEAQIAAQLEAGYTLADDAELAARLEAALSPDPVADLTARFTDPDT